MADNYPSELPYNGQGQQAQFGQPGQLPGGQTLGNQIPGGQTLGNQMPGGQMLGNNYNPYPSGPTMGYQQAQSPKSSVVAGLLQFFLGGLGVGNFYAGKTTLGLIQLLLTLVAFPLDLIFIGFLIHAIVGIWAFVESILYFIKSGSYGFDGDNLPLQ